MYVCMYVYVYCTVNISWLRVTEKSVFPTSFNHGRIQGNLFSFKRRKWLQKVLFDVRCLKIHHNRVAFSLTPIDEN